MLMIKKLILSASWACWAAWLLPFKHSLVCPASAADTFLSLGTDGSSATLLTTHLAPQQLAPQMIKILWRSTLIFPKTFFDIFFFNSCHIYAIYMKGSSIRMGYFWLSEVSTVPPPLWYTSCWSLSSLQAGMWNHSAWNHGAGSTMLSAWVLTGLQLQSKHDFYREMTPLCSTYVWPISILIAG